MIAKLSPYCFKRSSLKTGILISILAATLVSCSGGSSKADKVISVEDSNPEMNRAIAQARELLPEFWKIFEHPQHGEQDFALKVKITDKHGTEHFWAIDVERKDGKIRGTINNDPDIVKNVKLGQRLEIPEADISDWLFVREGKMVGNYTMRVLFKQMPDKEVKAYQEKMADL
jgi:uncharacterized protein YegJ (DUF2314 family)